MDFLNAVIDRCFDTWYDRRYFLKKLFGRAKVEQETQVVADNSVENKDEQTKEWKRPVYERSYDPYISRYADTEHLQLSHQTKYNRFPKIFESAKLLRPDAKRILSFGCSTGEECQRLAELFPYAEIIGVDIDEYSIKTARRKNRFPDRIFFHDDLGATGTYDLVLVLMVLFSLEQPIPRDRFVKVLTKLDKYINPNGILMVYTSDFDPKEVPEIAAYEAFNEWKRNHEKKPGREYFNGYYRKRTPEEMGIYVWRTSELVKAEETKKAANEVKVDTPAPEELSMVRPEAMPIVKPDAMDDGMGNTPWNPAAPTTPLNNPWINKNGVEDPDDYDPSTGGIRPTDIIPADVPPVHY